MFSTSLVFVGSGSAISVEVFWSLSCPCWLDVVSGTSFGRGKSQVIMGFGWLKCCRTLVLLVQSYLVLKLHFIHYLPFLFSNFYDKHVWYISTNYSIHTSKFRNLLVNLEFNFIFWNYQSILSFVGKFYNYLDGKLRVFLWHIDIVHVINSLLCIGGKH